MHASRSHDEMQRCRKQDRDQHVDAEHQRIRRGLVGKRHREQSEQHHGSEQLEGQGRGPDRVFALDRTADGALRPAEQTVWPRDQHDRHDQKFGDQRQLREIDGEAADMHNAKADAQRLDLGDDDRGQEGSGNGAHAADHDDDESLADHDQVERKIGRLARHLKRAAYAGEEGAQHEHDREQQRLVDAERADHLTVLRRGTDQPSEASLGQHQMEQQKDGGADDDQEEVVTWEVAAENLDRAAQSRRPRPEQVFRAPQVLHRVVDDEHQRESREQLEKFGRLVDSPQQHNLDQRAECRNHQSRRNDAAPEAEHATQPGGERIGQIQAQHVERAVGDIDDAGDAEDQRQSGADEEQARCRGQSVQGLKEKGFKAHAKMQPSSDPGLVDAVAAADAGRLDPSPSRGRVEPRPSFTSSLRPDAVSSLLHRKEEPLLR